MMHFDDNKKIKTYKDSHIFARLFKYVKPVKASFIISFILTILVVLTDLVPALIEGHLVGILNSDRASNDKLMISLSLIGAFLVVIILTALISYFNSMILQRAGQKIVLKLRRDVFVHIENLSIGQINETPIGKLVTRVTSDMNMINELFTNVIVNVVKYILTIIFVLIMMIIMSPILTLYLCIIAPILIVITVIFRRISRKQYRRVRGSVSNMNAFLSENISGMKITQIFNQEEKKLEEFKKYNNQLKRNSLKEIFIFGVFRPLIYVLFVVAQIIILYRGYFIVKANKAFLPNYISFYRYVRVFFNPIQQLADQFNQLQSAFSSAERIFEILDTSPKILDCDDAIEIDKFEGKIEFDHVWFAYKENEWILKDVSFTVEPNQTVAFVGATGAGKTTILALIVRNYEIQKGQIRIDGIDITKIKIESLRKHIGQMLQDVFLFSGTIKSNITLREEAFTNEEVMEACKYVNADKFINRLDGGLEYKVLERGVNFSSGQRQLLSFARTIIHKPNIMILDEATANIDTETEVLIQDSLNKMMNVGTMLIVAHRLSTIKNADNIIVLHKGTIAESGTHEELLAKKGLYNSLYEIQYKNEK